MNNDYFRNRHTQHSDNDTMDKIYGYIIPNHITTNENLENIVVGLDVNTEDTVLAICGSGDQPLALLEKARKVIAIDYDNVQLEYAKNRFRIVSDEAFELFRNPITYLKHINNNSVTIDNIALSQTLDEPVAKRIRDNSSRSALIAKYFTNDRLNIIRDKISMMELFYGDIYNPEMYGLSNLQQIEENENNISIGSHKGKFDKIYLSNSPNNITEYRFEKLNFISKITKIGGLIHITRMSRGTNMEDLECATEGRLIIDKELTTIARTLSNDITYDWRPTVYRRV